MNFVGTKFLRLKTCLAKINVPTDMIFEKFKNV